MVEYSKMEIGVGLFVLAGVAALAYLALSLGSLQIVHADQVRLTARFATAGDLKEGAPVKVAGVDVGKVEKIALDNYEAVATLAVSATVPLPADTIAAIRTTGLLGDSYVSLSPGASEKNLHDGDRIAQTEPPLDLVDLISQYALGQEDRTSGEPSTPKKGDP